MKNNNNIKGENSESLFVSTILQEIIDEKQFLVWIQNKSGKIIFYNKAFRAFFNIDESNEPENSLSTKIIDELTSLDEEKSLCSKLTKTAKINEKEIKIEKRKLSIRDDEGYINYGYLSDNNAYYSDTVYLKALLENIPYQIYFKDTKSRFTLINQAQADMLGLKSPEEAIGKTDFDFFTSDHAKDAFEDEQKIIKSGQPLILKIERIRNADGKFAWMNTTKVAIKDENNKPIGIVGISYDITEKIITENQLKKAKEKAEESDHLKTAFLANMSHEIRTPMNGIIGFINLLKEPNLTDDERNEFFSYIENCTRTLLTLIDDIIDISKIESGQLSVIKVEVDVQNVIVDFIKDHEESIKILYDKPVELKLNLPVTEDKIIVYTDPYRLRQILSNLINNAFKYTNKGYVELGYQVENNYIRFYVKDTGIGIPEDKKEIIFERFGQANQSIYLSSKGTGLGLSISKNLVHMLGGEIWFESVENKGSTFYFKIPLNDEKENKKVKLGPRQTNNYSWKDKTILIIGSFSSEKEKLKEYLSNTDINILWADSDEKAFKLYLEHSQIHIIILECCENISTSKNILNILMQNRNEIPVLVVMKASNYTEYSYLKDKGCTDVIIKPIEKKIFLDKASKYIL